MSLPDGVTLAGDTLSGMPTETGDFEVTVTASNGVSPAAVQTFELTVEEGAAAPVIALAPGQAAITNVEPIEFTVTFDQEPVGFDEAPDEDAPGDEDEGDEDEDLPRTGSDAMILALGALALIGAGGALYLAAQRRRLDT